MSRLRSELAALPLLLAAVLGAAYEVAVAREWISLGSVPGEGPPYEGWFLTTTLLALLAGSVASWVVAWRYESNMSVALLGVAAAVFVVARWQGFDPYYLPTMRRYSDAGTFSLWWVYGVALLATLGTALAFTRSRFGYAVNGPALLLCAFTATFAGVGH
jgi:hypothetical protein